MNQINLIPIWLDKIIYENKPKLNLVLRNIFSFISTFLFYLFLIILIGHFKSNRVWLGLLFALLTYLSLILYNWFKPNYKEIIVNNLNKIEDLIKKKKHNKIILKIENITDQMYNKNLEEYNVFNENVITRLGDYITLFVYPILLSTNDIDRRFIYKNLIKKLKNIFENNYYYLIPELLDKFDRKFMKRNSVKKSLTLYYEKKKQFFNQPIVEKIIKVRDELKEKQKGIFEKILDFIKQNQTISAPILLVILYLIIRLIFGIEPLCNV